MMRIIFHIQLPQCKISKCCTNVCGKLQEKVLQKLFLEQIKGIIYRTQIRRVKNNNKHGTDSENQKQVTRDCN